MLVIARWARMTLKHQKADSLDRSRISDYELMQLMSELISLREKVAQAELNHGDYGVPREEPRQMGETRCRVKRTAPIPPE